MFRLGREIHAHSLRQRAMRRLRGLLGADHVKSHEVHFRRIGEQTYKRIRFSSVSEAAAVEEALERFGPSPSLPECVIRYGNELWLEYVPGELLDPRRHAVAEMLPAFFADIYRRDCRRVSLSETPLPARLERDIRFLSESQLLPADMAERLADRAVRLEPQRVWLGYDYLDPLPKNFIVRNGVLVGVDVEALRDGIPLGTGPAKAFLRWCNEPEEGFLERLREAGAPDLREQFLYVELCFLTTYAKQKSFQRKSHLAPIAMFERFLK